MSRSGQTRIAKAPLRTSTGFQFAAILRKVRGVTLTGQTQKHFHGTRLSPVLMILSPTFNHPHRNPRRRVFATTVRG